MGTFNLNLFSVFYQEGQLLLSFAYCIRIKEIKKVKNEYFRLEGEISEVSYIVIVITISIQL